MQSNSERLLLFGLLGLIAWELWPKSAPAPMGSVANDPLSNTPPWVQQLSIVEQFDCPQASPDALECLLAIPQGPGGTYTSVPQGPGGSDQIVNYFNPVQGIFSLCNQVPANIVRPSLWSM